MKTSHGGRLAGRSADFGDRWQKQQKRAEENQRTEAHSQDQSKLRLLKLVSKAATRDIAVEQSRLALRKRISLEQANQIPRTEQDHSKTDAKDTQEDRQQELASVFDNRFRLFLHSRIEKRLSRRTRVGFRRCERIRLSIGHLSDLS